MGVSRGTSVFFSGRQFPCPDNVARDVLDKADLPLPAGIGNTEISFVMYWKHRLAEPACIGNTGLVLVLETRILDVACIGNTVDLKF